MNGSVLFPSGFDACTQKPGGKWWFGRCQYVFWRRPKKSEIEHAIFFLTFQACREHRAITASRLTRYTSTNGLGTRPSMQCYRPPRQRLGLVPSEGTLPLFDVSDMERKYASQQVGSTYDTLSRPSEEARLQPEKARPHLPS